MTILSPDMAQREHQDTGRHVEYNGRQYDTMVIHLPRVPCETVPPAFVPPGHTTICSNSECDLPCVPGASGLGYSCSWPVVKRHRWWRPARGALMRDEAARMEGIQTLVAFLREHVATVQHVAARTDRLLDQEVLEDVCRDMARLLDRVLAIISNQRSAN